MNLRDQLQAALGTAFTLDRELTAGGMSRVFLATETAFGRRVVVKVLHPDLAAEVTAERFTREIQVVAKLQQANIVPLLTTGHAGEVPYYTMPFVEGLSLRQRLTDSGRLGIGEVIGILRDVARALAYAHDSGVVHRDIKPENILISGGAAVVTDFGIAKAISVSRTQPGAATLTQAGAGIGTPAYMAPEQAAGDPTVDHRVDIYAFGCLAYELLAGRPPFMERTVHELVTAQMTKTPALVTTFRADTPMRLAQLVMRCLEKQPGARPQTARDLLDSLDAVSRLSGAASGPMRGSLSRGAWVAIVAGVAALLFVILKTDVFRRGAGGAQGADAEPTIAVIPFANAGGDSTQDYLADGISDELATSIGKIPGVRITSRSGAYRYRGRRDVDVREVGTTLGVLYVVQGTVRRAGQQLRVSAQLTDATTGVELWSDNFDRSAQDVFKTQDDITAAIATALPGRAVASRPAAGGAVHGTRDVGAFDLYMRGEFALRQRQIPIATDMFQRAIQRDPGFARAYAGLSQTLVLSPYFTPISAASILGRVVEAANTALARDSSLAEAWMSLAIAHMHAGRWDEARLHFDRAVAADPSDLQTHFQFGRFHLNRGDNAAALDEWAKAKAIDPFAALAAGWSAYALSLQGRNVEALAEAARALQYDSTTAVIRLNVLRVYLLTGMTAEARAAANRLPDISPWNGTRAYAYARTGVPDSARAFVRRLEVLPTSLWMRNTSLAYAYLGLADTARALTAIERAIDAGEILPSFYPVHDPLFDPVRGTARWAAVMKRVGLEKSPGAIR